MLGISAHHYKTEKCKIIFAIYMADKGIIFKIHIKFL